MENVVDTVEVEETADLIQDIQDLPTVNMVETETDLVNYQHQPIQQPSSSESSDLLDTSKFQPTSITVIYPSEEIKLYTEDPDPEFSLLEESEEVDPGTGTVMTMTKEIDSFDEFPTTGCLPSGSEVVSTEGKCTVISCRITSEQEWILWFEEFKRNSNTSWIARSSKPNSKYFAFSKDYVCRRSSYRKLDTSKIGCHCAATLAVRILNPMKSKRAREQHSKDGLWGIVRISNKHNHTTSTAEALSYLPPSTEVRSKFEEYFAAGMNVSEACKKHLHYLQTISDESSVSTLANGALNPKVRTVRWWYEVWRQQYTVLNGSPDVVQIMEVEVDDLIQIEHHHLIEDEYQLKAVEPQQLPVNTSNPNSVSDITPLLNKLNQLDQKFSTSQESYDTMMKNLQNIKTKSQWDSFLVQAPAHDHETQENGEITYQKKTKGGTTPQVKSKKLTDTPSNNVINIDLRYAV